MERRRDSLALVVLLGLGLAYQLCLFREGVGLIDEGHLANAARRVAAGEVLYRDVYTVYPPASFYVVAGLFELFGTSLLVARGFHIAMTLALSALVFVAGRRFMDTPFAWLAGALVAATGWHVILEGCHYAYLYGAVPMAALVLLARADAAGELDRGRLIGVGVLAGVSLAFRLEPFVGIALAGASVVVLREGIGIRAATRLAWLVVGTLLVAIPIGLYFSVHGAFAELFRAVFWTSFGQYLQGGEFNLPMPALEWLPVEWSRRGLRLLFVSWEFRLPILLYVVAFAEVAFTVWRQRRSRKAISSDALGRLCLALFGTVLYLRATGRSDYYHLAPILFPAYLLGADWIARGWHRCVPPRLNAIAYPFVVLVLAGSLFIHQFDLAVPRAFAAADEVEVVPDGPRIERASRLGELVADVRARTRPDEPIVVLPWYPIVYFLTERANPTKFDWLFPGYLKTDAAVEGFIDEIERSDVRVVVYSPTSIDGRSDRSLAAFAPAIDRFLRQRFQATRRHGHFWVMTRKLAPSAQP